MVIQTFIFDSSLSCKTRLNSWTSCCINESSDFHPNDFVSSFVPVGRLIVEPILSSKGAYQLVDQMFAIHRILFVRRGLHFLMQRRFLLVFGTQPVGCLSNQEPKIVVSSTLRK
jgi:hypothetical protein